MNSPQNIEFPKWWFMKRCAVFFKKLARVSIGLTGIIVLENCSDSSKESFSEQYRFDDEGRLISSVLPEGNWSEFLYNEQGLLSEARYPDGMTHYSYDENGNRVWMRDTTGTTEYYYDAFNRLAGVISEHSPRYLTLYDYDPWGNVTGIKIFDLQLIEQDQNYQELLQELSRRYAYNMQEWRKRQFAFDQLTDKLNREEFNRKQRWLKYQVGYQYNGLGNIKSVNTQWGKIRYIYHWDKNQIERQLSNGISSWFTFTSNGLIESIRHENRLHELLREYRYKYDHLGMVKTIEEIAPNSTKQISFIRNNRGFPTEVHFPNGEKMRYEYDPFDNITLIEDRTGITKLDYDEHGRLIQAGKLHFEWNKNGLLVAITGGERATRFGYDSRGYPIKIETHEAAIQIKWDFDGNIISITTKRNETLQHLPHTSYSDGMFVYENPDGQKLIPLEGESDSGGMVVDMNGSVVNSQLPSLPWWDIKARFKFLEDLGESWVTNPPGGHWVWAGLGKTGLDFLRFFGSSPWVAAQEFGEVFGDPTAGIGQRVFKTLMLAWEASGLMSGVATALKVPGTLQKWGPGRLILMGGYKYRIRGRLDDLITSGSLKNVNQNIAKWTARVNTAEEIYDYYDLGATTWDLLKESYSPLFKKDKEAKASSRAAERNEDQKNSDSKRKRRRNDFDQNFLPFFPCPPFCGGPCPPFCGDGDNGNPPPCPPFCKDDDDGDDDGGGGPPPPPPPGGSGTGFFPAMFAKNFKDPSVSIEKQLGGIELSSSAEFIGDLGRITGAVFDPEKKYLVLVGDAGRSVPSIKAEDLAVALALVYGRTPQEAQFSLDPADSSNPGGEWLKKVYIPKEILKGTYFGETLFEADWLLKQYSFGVEFDENNQLKKRASSVRGFKSVADLLFEEKNFDNSEARWARYWIVSDRMLLKQSGQSIVFDAAQMRVKAKKQVVDPSSPTGLSDVDIDDPISTQFSELFTERYDEIAKETPSFERLKELAKAVAFTKWLKKEAIPVDRDWIIDYVNRRIATFDRITALSCRWEKQNQTPFVSGGQTGIQTNIHQLHLFGGVDLTVRPEFSEDDGTAALLEKAVRDKLSRSEIYPIFNIKLGKKSLFAAILPITAEGKRIWENRSHIINKDGIVYGLNEQKRVVKSIDRYENMAEYGYDSIGRLNRINIDSRDGSKSNYRKTEKGSVWEVTDARGACITYQYDGAGYLRAIEANGKTFATVEFRPEKQRIEIRYDEHTIKVAYNINGKGVEYQVQTIRENLGSTPESESCIISYNEFGYPTKVSGNAIPSISISYLPDGVSPATITTPQNQIQFDYDSQSRFTKIQQANGMTSSYTYKDTLLTKLQINYHGKQAEYFFNENGLTQSKNLFGEMVDYKYDADKINSLWSDRYGGISYVYDDYKRLKEMYLPDGSWVEYKYLVDGSETKSHGSSNVHNIRITTYPSPFKKN